MEAAARRLGAWQAAHFRREGLRLERLMARLEPANVAKLLARGFALVLHGGRLVTRSAAVDPGQEVRIALGTGWLDAQVISQDQGSDPLPGREQEAAQGGGPASAGAGVDPPARRR